MGEEGRRREGEEECCVDSGKKISVRDVERGRGRGMEMEMEMGIEMGDGDGDGENCFFIQEIIDRSERSSVEGVMALEGAVRVEERGRRRVLEALAESRVFGLEGVETSLERLVLVAEGLEAVVVSLLLLATLLAGDGGRLAVLGTLADLALLLSELRRLEHEQALDLGLRDVVLAGLEVPINVVLRFARRGGGRRGGRRVRGALALARRLLRHGRRRRRSAGRRRRGGTPRTSTRRLGRRGRDGLGLGVPLSRSSREDRLDQAGRDAQGRYGPESRSCRRQRRARLERERGRQIRDPVLLRVRGCTIAKIVQRREGRHQHVGLTVKGRVREDVGKVKRIHFFSQFHKFKQTRTIKTKNEEKDERSVSDKVFVSERGERVFCFRERNRERVQEVP